MARYDDAQIKASHNSYSKRRGLSLAQQLDGVPSDPAALPCRGLELDIVQAKNRLHWQVAHTGPYQPNDPARKSLGVWLRRLRKWCEKHPGHDVITLHLDMKNAPKGTDIAEYAEGLDGYVAGALGARRIFRPGDMMAGFPDLVSAGRAGRWPDVSKMKNKVVICLSGRPKRKERYGQHEPASRLCFVDRSWARWVQPPPRRGDWLFLNVLILNRTPKWKDIERFVRTDGFVVRGFNIVNPGRWAEAKREGLNILSTDALRDPKFVMKPGSRRRGWRTARSSAKVGRPASR